MHLSIALLTIAILSKNPQPPLSIGNNTGLLYSTENVTSLEVLGLKIVSGLSTIHMF